MTPRRYRMQARAHKVGATRERIIRAATELHSEHGVLATSWEDIAKRAEVAPATVYRHFPSLVELIPACARTIFDLIEPPTLDQARRQFAGLPGPPQRLEALIRSSCVCYEKGEAWLHAARRERDLIPAVGDAVQLQEDSLEVLVRAAVRGSGVSRQEILVLKTLADFPFWKALVDAGIARASAVEIVVELSLRRLHDHSNK